MRLQLELLKPELLLREHRIDSTVVVFGSARIPAPKSAGARAGRAKPMPILLFDERYWRRIVNFDAMVDEGVISRGDRDLVRYVESAEVAWQAICAHYGIDPALADGGS